MVENRRGARERGLKTGRGPAKNIRGGRERGGIREKSNDNNYRENEISVWARDAWGGGRGGGQTSRMSFPVASFAPSGKKRGTREREKWKDRRGERERATPRKTDPRKGEKVGKGGGRKIGGRTLSCSPFERERERVDGGGIYARVLQSCVAHRSVCHCVRYN